MKTENPHQIGVDETVLREKQLAECVNNIKSLHTHVEECNRICEDQGKKSIQAAIALGNELEKAKNLVEHGQWAKWIKANFAFTQRTAENYMALADPKHVSILKGCDSLRQAYIAIGRIKAKPTSTDHQKPDDAGNTSGSSAAGSNSRRSGKKSSDPFKTAETLVKNLIKNVYVEGNEDNLQMIRLLQPLVDLYDEYFKRNPRFDLNHVQIPIDSLPIVPAENN